MRFRVGAGLALSVLLATAGLGTSVTRVSAAPVISTADTSGQGWYPDEAALSPSVVASASFGSRWSASVSGQVYAPLIRSGSTVIAATENNEVDGLSLSAGAALWTHSLGQPWPTSTISCTDITPTVGVTGRPVLSPDGSTLYAASKTYTGTDTAHPVYKLHALSVATGAELTGWPVTIAGPADNDPSVTFNPLALLQRPALVLLSGVVYVAFGSLCDNPLARGWIAGVSTTTAKLTALFTTEAHTTASKPLGSVWESGAELVSDAPGQLIFATGNGATPPVGSTAPHTLANSVVRLSVGSAGKLAVQDFFAPYNADTLNVNDQDLGSGGPTLLPSIFGTTSHPSVILQGGKAGYLYLLDAAKFGGRGSTQDNVVQKLGQYGRIFSQPAVYPGEGGYVYSLEDGKPLLAFKNTPTTGGMPHLSKVAQSSATFYFTSSSAVVTSNGTTPGSALVWAIHSPTKDGLNSTLVAFKAVPVGNVLTQVFSAPIGTAAKFGRPLVADGNVLVGTRTGTVLDFGSSHSQVTIGDPAAGGWTLNGSAKIVSGATQLTAALTKQAGSAVFPTAVSSRGITANFTSTIGGGTGADGLTLALLDASTSTPTSLGAAGDGEGFGGLPGVAVALDTYKGSTADPSNNFVGVATGYVNTKLTFAATASAIPALRTGTHQWQVSTNAAGALSVSVDGTVVLQSTVPLPPMVYLAFTGGTGGSTDIHTVSNVSATASQ